MLLYASIHGDLAGISCQCSAQPVGGLLGSIWAKFLTIFTRAIASALFPDPRDLTSERWSPWALPIPARSAGPVKTWNFVNQAYPGALCDDVNYVCVAGKAIEGEKADWFTFNSYKITGGDGFVWGDGIVPISAAHLDGATSLTLDQVFHSPRPNHLWYGSKAVVKEWSQWLASLNRVRALPPGWVQQPLCHQRRAWHQAARRWALWPLLWWA